MKMDIIICGVGGQGNLLASAAMANYAMGKGLAVVSTETIGAAQRGGSVVSHLRIADSEIFSPIVPYGSADILLGFEPVEALRHINKLHPEGSYIVNEETVPTVLCNMGMDRYPSMESITAELNRFSSRGHLLNASDKARELGSIIMTNVVLLGAMTRVINFFEKDGFISVLKDIIPPKVLEVNLKAFAAGYELVN